ncbi:Rho-type gtpase-activating protein [Microsporum canis]|uniref:Chimerin 1 n=1 Tax=Arthroderma otae (strain ATCC MYA-4605 / CBS 113480) TaxID=554155 RepID=C5FEN4_ARTOC|nr:chimerin 1 [Microsporum canis CBS 113480]EEQ28358.1 chimerin 1 [Microsporum canis CBS 113480]
MDMDASASTESPDDQDDFPIHCKGCGEILEEGKAFELAGNRWHIDCFRCHTCGAYLDSDVNLLMVGDGSLVCRNCAYSCSSCGSKIDDVAIVTGEQAFCAGCFKCRNCKKKIENLRYARTSQGIFCMDCHESLMSRRRKRTARNAAQRQKPPAPNMHLDKSLPSLPPSMMVPENSAPPPSSSDIYSDSTSEHLPQSRQEEDRGTRSYSSNHQDNQLLPSSTYNSNRHSVATHRSDGSGNEEFLIPVAFDPTPSEHASPHLSSPNSSMTPNDGPKDYFGRGTSSALGITGDGPSMLSPSHIAYQDKRQINPNPQQWLQETVTPPQAQPSINSNQRSDSHSARTSMNIDTSRLSQEVSRSKDQVNSDRLTPGERSSNRHSVPGKDALVSQSSNFNQRKKVSNEKSNPGTISSPSNQLQYPPKRGDSLESSKLHQNIQRKDIPPPSLDHAEKPEGTVRSSTSSDYASVTSKVIESTPPTQSNATATAAPSRTRSASGSASTYTLPSDTQRQASSGSSPGLLRYSAVGDFSLDEDMARILGDDPQAQDSFLRKVSNSVRHGRSFSDKGSRLSRELKWPAKSPPGTDNPGNDISSPIPSGLESKDELIWLRNELKRERQKVIEKDQKILELETSLNATVNIKQVNTELREKRSTMIFLDAQKEIILRELEVWKEHIAAEKKNNKPLDLGKMSNSVLRDLAESLESLKNTFAPQIEELIQKRNDLVEELANIGRMKDKSFQEFEQLSLKNAQLAELNNQLVHQIQELYKANSNTSSGSNRQTPNGLGIYSHQKDKSSTSLEARSTPYEAVASNSSVTVPEEAEPATVIQGPHVVNIRKGQPKKFTWKKGQNVAKGVTKGLKGAFLYQREGQLNDNSSIISTSQQESNGSGMPRSQTQDPSRQGFGFFGNQKGKPTPWKGQSNGSSPGLDTPTSLFGGELEQRLEIEKAVIPSIVMRCIEEVELRGMDVEGIYRKSGGSSQVQTIREGFERSRDYDISDPDLDINAITSTLKQYFRMLPTPLVTYPVYDILLEATNVTPISARIEMIQQALQELPRVHRDVLEFLVFHLKRVVDREKENLMTSLNIAVVFAPTILRPESLSREMTDVQKKNETIQFMVENCQDIFMGIEE